MWDDLERIAWRRLEHNYGAATDVPGWLRDCASDDAERAAAALDDLDVAVYHQGCWICSAAPVTLPFLVDLATGRAVHHRPAIVELIARFLNEAASVEPRLVDEAHAELPAAAWAHWRVTADPALALAALAGTDQHKDLHKLGDLGPLAASETSRLRRLTASRDDWVRIEAAYAHYRVTADPGVAVAVLTDVARPLADGTCIPVMITAMEYLAAIAPAAEPVHSIARAVLDSPRRLSYFGGWHVFEEDERLRTAATTLLS